MKLRSTFTVILAALMMSEGAFALSCMKPDLVKTLEEAKASDKLYHILVGKFVSETRVEQVQSPTPWLENRGPIVAFPQGQKSPTITRSWFEGIGLTKDKRTDGQLTRFPVDIETSCAGPWCSSPPSPEREVIAFVEARDGQAPILKVSPCPTWVFSADIPAKVQTIRQCLDKDCGSEDMVNQNGVPPRPYLPQRPSEPEDQGLTSWTNALEILNSGRVTTISQMHNLEVTLFLSNGTVVKTIEPRIDAIFAEVRNCTTCGDIPMMTE